MNTVLFYSTRLKAGQSSNQQMLRFVHYSGQEASRNLTIGVAGGAWASDIRMSSFADCINLTEQEGLTDHLICRSCPACFYVTKKKAVVYTRVPNSVIEENLRMKGFLIGVLIGVLLIAGSVYYYFVSGTAPAAVADPPML